MSLLRVYLQTTLGISIQAGVRYALIAGLAWLLFYVFFKRRLKNRKIIARMPASSEVWREMQYAALTILIFGAVGAATWFAVLNGMTQVYFRISEHGWAWFSMSVVLAILLHDTWFYWTHRLMHHRKLFAWFHRTHHLSHNPTPWAAYAFGPLEAVVQAAIFPLIVVLIPIHLFAFVAFMAWQITFNVIGHAGYEIFPRWLLDCWLGKFLNTPTNHIMHHEHFHANYGLYFNVWDRLMGTNHERYEERFREVTQRRTM
jgi:Delta7-sterol 5-desaturase